LIAMRGLFHRYVQVGRLAVINFGANHGKLCTIVDIIDHNRVLVDGPVTVTGIRRQPYNLKRLALTGLRMKVSKGIRQKALTQALKDHKILEKWKKSAWAKKITARRNKDNLNDFQRFVVFLAKAKRNKLVTNKVKQLLEEKKRVKTKITQGRKLKKAGKPLPKSLQRLFDKQVKKREAIVKMKAQRKAKLEAEQKDKKSKPKHHGYSWLLKQKSQKLHRALEKKAEVKHEKNLKLKKRKREKLKSGEKPKEKETPTEKKRRIKKAKFTKEAPKEGSKVGPKEVPKVTPKATSKKVTPKATSKKATPKTAKK